MSNWFEVSISYEREIEGGSMKKFTELYLVDALSFTEAEARITQEMTPYIGGDFAVVSIKRANYSEIFGLDKSFDKYYACKVEFISLDEKTGAERRTPNNLLVSSDDMNDAKTLLETSLGETMSDYKVVAIQETKIVDVFQHLDIQI